MPVSADERRNIAQCFKDRHNNIPVAFLSTEPSGLRLLGYEDATADLEACFKGKDAAELSWKDFDADA